LPTIACICYKSANIDNLNLFVISFYDLGRGTLRTFSRGLPIKTIGEGASGAPAIYLHYMISAIDLYCFHVGLWQDITSFDKPDFREILSIYLKLTLN